MTLPEYSPAEQSRPPAPNFADFPIRVDGITIYEPAYDPRFPVLTKRFIATNALLWNKKEAEFRGLQNPNIELKFEVKVELQGLHPHPIINVAK